MSLLYASLMFNSKLKESVVKLDKESTEIKAEVKILRGEIVSIKWLGGILITIGLLNLTATFGGIYFIVNYVLAHK